MDPQDCMEIAEELGKIKESEGMANEQEEIEVHTILAELQEIVKKAGFLAAQ